MSSDKYIDRYSYKDNYRYSLDKKTSKTLIRDIRRNSAGQLIKNLQNLIGLDKKKLKSFIQSFSLKECIEDELIEFKKYISKKNLLAST